MGFHAVELPAEVVTALAAACIRFWSAAKSVRGCRCCASWGTCPDTRANQARVWVRLLDNSSREVFGFTPKAVSNLP